ncbi:hypothetical protein PN462_16225 [Spirulina sp. CS-785/01]|uniref:hypothetical protein n=1 Tax=Spirulina sp. CS-785/01 TaxID=3021716 RepID=UPI00232AA602|nr:hypothetical protein [Spirulina sp. CS-785/01]MDB9314660.1 hypothetical protein [Spirulina sp. CS-785/01]
MTSLDGTVQDNLSLGDRLASPEPDTDTEEIEVNLGLKTQGSERKPVFNRLIL